jgi:hypothetical protein
LRALGGNCRRDLLDHVIVFNERQLKRLIHGHIRYYYEDRTYFASRAVELNISSSR